MNSDTSKLTKHDRRSCRAAARRLQKEWVEDPDGGMPSEILCLSPGYVEVFADGTVVSFGQVIHTVPDVADAG